MIPANHSDEYKAMGRASWWLVIIAIGIAVLIGIEFSKERPTKQETMEMIDTLAPYRQERELIMKTIEKNTQAIIELRIALSKITDDHE